MKQIILIAAAICSVSTANAQKNSVLYFGNCFGNHTAYDLGSSTTGTIKDNRFLLNSGVGYQFTKHITVGVQGGFQTSNVTHRDLVGGNYVTLTSRTSEYGVGLFGRYTQYLGDRFFVFLQADAGYNNMTLTPGNTSRHTLGANLYPTVGVFVYKGWALNFGIGGVRYRNGDIGAKSSLTYSLGQELRIGVSKNFTKRKKDKE